MSVVETVQETTNFMIVTLAAEQHFRSLLQQEDLPGMNLRMFVANPGTPQAEIGVTFCPSGEESDSDIPFGLNDFILFVDKSAKQALTDAHIDFQADDTGGQLSIKAPNLKGRAPENNTGSLEERLSHALDRDVNPMLAGHGGKVSLVEIVGGTIAILRFGGGCHGCSMVNVTLKQGIEKTIKEKFPEIVEIRDVTDHITGVNPYY